VARRPVLVTNVARICVKCLQRMRGRIIYCVLSAFGWKVVMVSRDASGRDPAGKRPTPNHSHTGSPNRQLLPTYMSELGVGASNFLD
jgi:hypothetical protein